MFRAGCMRPIVKGLDCKMAPRRFDLSVQSSRQGDDAWQHASGIWEVCWISRPMLYTRTIQSSATQTKRNHNKFLLQAHCYRNSKVIGTEIVCPDFPAPLHLQPLHFATWLPCIHSVAAARMLMIGRQPAIGWQLACGRFRMLPQL